TSPAGAYTVSGLGAGTYTVIPSLAGYSFTPANRPVTITAASVTGIDFAAAVNTFSISGTITSGGVGLGGVRVVAGGVAATTSLTGAYTISGLPAGPYTVVP